MRRVVSRASVCYAIIEGQTRRGVMRLAGRRGDSPKKSPIREDFRAHTHDSTQAPQQTLIESRLIFPAEPSGPASLHAAPPLPVSRARRSVARQGLRRLRSRKELLVSAFQTSNHIGTEARSMGGVGPAIAASGNQFLAALPAGCPVGVEAAPRTGAPGAERPVVSRPRAADGRLLSHHGGRVAYRAARVGRHAGRRSCRARWSRRHSGPAGHHDHDVVRWDRLDPWSGAADQRRCAEARVDGQPDTRRGDRALRAASARPKHADVGLQRVSHRRAALHPPAARDR